VRVEHATATTLRPPPEASGPIVLYLNRDPPNMTADNPGVKEEHR
jgi:hypothetical protein